MVRCLLTRRFTITDGAGQVVAAHDVELHAAFTVVDGSIADVVVDPVG